MVRDLDNPRAVALFRKEYRLHLRLSMRCEGVCRMFGICENHPLFKTCFVMKRYKCSLLDEIRAVPGGGGITMERLLELGATLARKVRGSENELVVISLWADMTAAAHFIKGQFDDAVVKPGTQKLLKSFDVKVEFFETLISTGIIGGHDRALEADGSVA